MTSNDPFENALQHILARDERYDIGAYCLVRDAVTYTVDAHRDELDGTPRHVSGAELCEGFRDLVLDAFGPLAIDVLRAWGVTETLDVGNIVFNLVKAHVLGIDDSDKVEDFMAVYDFEDVFVQPFECREPVPAELPVIA